MQTINFNTIDFNSGASSGGFIGGYYHEGQFYKDKEYTLLITPSEKSLYIDLAEHRLYIYSEGEYRLIGDGTVIIVQTTGDSTSAVMSQKAVTDALNAKQDKFEPELTQLATINGKPLIYGKDLKIEDTGGD